MTGFDVTAASRVVGGTVEGSGGGARIARAVIDSRDAEPGDLFVALPGTRADGKAFVADALARGAVAALVPVDAPPLPPDLADRAQIRVKFPRKALADLAAAHRRTLRCPVVAVTGTNGKSSTREMTAKALEPLGPVVQSLRSHNNDLGVPLTVLRADDSTAALVVEMGTSARGEIAGLCDIARPDVGVVTNVAPAHLDGLGSVEGVALEKGALPAAVPHEGFVVLNADDPRVAAMARRTTAQVVTASLDDLGATVWAVQPRRTVRGIEFFLYGRMRVFVPVPGLHNVRNALAACAVGLLSGVDPLDIRIALRRVRLPSLRMQRVAFRGVTMLLDCYNANPASLDAAVEELASRRVAGRRILVLGDMLELGAEADALHHDAGRRLSGRVDELWGVGPLARIACEGATEAGMDPARVHWSPTVEQALLDPRVCPERGDVVLYKASRGMRLERLADTLRRVRAAAPPAPAPAPETPAEGKIRKVG